MPSHLCVQHNDSLKLVLKALAFRVLFQVPFFQFLNKVQHHLTVADINDFLGNHFSQQKLPYKIYISKDSLLLLDVELFEFLFLHVCLFDF